MLVVILVLILVMLVVGLGISIALAFLLNWMLPAVGLDMALLIAVIAVSQAILAAVRILNALPPEPESEGDLEPPIVLIDRELNLPRRRRKRA
jgi:hypothetical protein